MGSTINNRQETIERNVQENVQNKSELTKYCIYLKPEGIGDLTKKVSDYLNYKNIQYRRPSLGNHVTLLTFWSDISDEEKIFYKMDKYRRSRIIEIKSPDIFGHSYDALVFKVSSNDFSNELSNTHRAIVSDMSEYIVLEGGIKAVNDPSLFRAKYPFILNRFNAHLTVAKKDNGKFNKKILHTVEQIIDTHDRTYKTELYLSKKNNEGKWELITGFQPTY